MSRLIPFGNVPDSNVFPDGIFRLKIEKIEAVMTKEREGKASKLMYKTTSKVVEPKAHAGLLYFDQFVIGTEDDPEAEELLTWQTSFGARNFKKLCAKTGVPMADEEDEESYLNNLKGAEYLATIVQKIEPDKKNINGVEVDNPYKGQVRNNTTAYWAIGEKDAALSNGHDKPATRGARTTAAKAPADGKPAPSDDVSCSACKKRVPRKDLKAHVQAHMDELSASGAGAGDDE